MNFKNIVNKETVTQVAFGTAGALSTLPLKKFVWNKVPVIQKKEAYQDIAGILLGVGIGAFARNSKVKTLGLGMSLMSAFNLAKPLVAKAGIGYVAPAPTLMGDVGVGDGVMMGSAQNAGLDYDAGAAGDATGGEAGEMDF